MNEIDWDNLDEFPHPNPYFPPPVRPRGGLPWLVSLPLFVGGALGTIYGLKYASDIGNWFLLVCGASFVVFMIGMVSFFTSFARLFWRFGRIVPVMVEVAAEALPLQTSTGCLVRMLLPPPLGLLTLLFRATRKDPNAMVVEYFDNGRVRSHTILTEEHWPKYASGDVAWVCVLPMCPPVLLERVAPSEFEVPTASAEVKRWLQRAIGRHTQFGNAEQRELWEAATEATKAFKRASIYDKRPD